MLANNCPNGILEFKSEPKKGVKARALMLKFNEAFLAWMEAGICETKKEEIKRDFNTNGLFLDNFCELTLLFSWKIK